MRLGYERIVKDKRIAIDVEESENPWVTLKIQGCDDIKLKASKPDDNSLELLPEMRDDIKVIADSVYQAYIQATTNPFK